MVYSEDLAQRVREALLGVEHVDERKMFGSIGFLVDGHLTVGIGIDDIMIRLDRADSEIAESEPGAKMTVMKGKRMKGWIDLEGEAIATDAALQTWIDRSVAFVKSLPPK